MKRRSGDIFRKGTSYIFVGASRRFPSQWYQQERDRNKGRGHKKIEERFSFLIPLYSFFLSSPFFLFSLFLFGQMDDQMEMGRVERTATVCFFLSSFLMEDRTDR
jgi:hypothetical protein